MPGVTQIKARHVNKPAGLEAAIDLITREIWQPGRPPKYWIESMEGIHWPW